MRGPNFPHHIVRSNPVNAWSRWELFRNECRQINEYSLNKMINLNLVFEPRLLQMMCECEYAFAKDLRASAFGQQKPVVCPPSVSKARFRLLRILKQKDKQFKHSLDLNTQPPGKGCPACTQGRNKNLWIKKRGVWLRDEIEYAQRNLELKCKAVC